jgi:hypothetical protein
MTQLVQAPQQQIQPIQAAGRLHKKGYFVLFGPPGGGKSFAGAKAFQNGLALLSAPNNLHFYEQWLALPEGQASGKRPPRRTIVLDKYAMIDSWVPPGQIGSWDRPAINIGQDGLPIPIPQKTWLENLLLQAIRRGLYEKAAGLPLTYQNILLDEAGTLWTRVFEEISATSYNKEGKRDTLAAYNIGETWSRSLVDLLRAAPLAGMNVSLVAHDKDPEPEKDKQGGPKFFSQAVMKQICADADGVFHRYVEDEEVAIDLSDPAKMALALMEAKKRPPRRRWRVYISKDWQSKFRGIPDSMMASIRDMELEDIIPLGGFAP